MIFWRENKLNAKFEAEPETVARLYVSAVRRGEDAKSAWARRWKDRFDAWLLERALRDWMTDKDGFNASWVDEDGFWDIYEATMKMAEEAGLYE